MLVKEGVRLDEGLASGEDADDKVEPASRETGREGLVRVLAKVDRHVWVQLAESLDDAGEQRPAAREGDAHAKRAVL